MKHVGQSRMLLAASFAGALSFSAANAPADDHSMVDPASTEPMPAPDTTAPPIAADEMRPYTSGRHAGKVPICTLGVFTRYLKPQDAVAEMYRGSYLGPCATLGDKRTLGLEAMQTYIQLNDDDSPYALGFAMPSRFFDGLPRDNGRTGYDGQHCFDTNGNGKLELDGSVMPDNPLHHDECVGGWGVAMDFPKKNKITPFQWGGVNWNSHGHSPDHVYSLAHFDFHFYNISYAAANFIRTGPCALLINCDDFVTATKPQPPGYLHPDYMSVGATEASMGDHLVDVTSHEWHGARFDSTFIFGGWDAKIDFWEPMITEEFIKSKPFMCMPIKLPNHYHETGWYPTVYCIRYRPSLKDYTVSIEGFKYRKFGQFYSN